MREREEYGVDPHGLQEGMKSWVFEGLEVLCAKLLVSFSAIMLWDEVMLFSPPFLSLSFPLSVSHYCIFLRAPVIRCHLKYI